MRSSPEMSYRPRVPPPSLVDGYSITPGQASTRPNVQCGPHRNRTPSPGQKKRPASGPSKSSRTNPVRVSGAPRMRTTSEPASHRCVLGMRRWRRGSIVATLTRPASLHYSVVVQVLLMGGENQNLHCPMDHLIAHTRVVGLLGIRRGRGGSDRCRRQSRIVSASRPGASDRRRDAGSRRPRCMQLAERPACHGFLNL